MSERSQFGLLTQRRFLPLFLTQFFGAANDNVFKFAFTVLATYSAAEWGGLDPKSAGAVIGGVFILPFVLFSATAGQLADKYDKAALMRFIKNLEIAIMLVIGAGFVWHVVALLFAGVFLMGLHSTLFGPVKYSLLPQVLRETGMPSSATLVTCPRSNRWVGAGDPPIDRFYASGVAIAVGTDSLASVADLNLFSELKMMRRLAPQVPARKILESATLVGAKALGLESDLGSITPGKRAQLICVQLPDAVDDVEEYLVSGIEPAWIQPLNS